MTTVLAVYNSEGCVGRCDANCHEAKSPTCDCICGGKNHGKGLEKAIENNRELIGLTPEDLAKFAEAHGYDTDALKVYNTLEKSTGQIRRERQRDKKREAWEARQKAYADLFKCEPVED